MTTRYPTLLTMVVVVGILATACGGSDDAADDGAAAEDGNAVVSDPEGSDTSGTPDGWQELSFPGGTIAVPPDWEEEPPVGSDDLLARGPEPSDGLAPVLRAQVTGRDDGAPIDVLPNLFGTQLAMQGLDVAPVGDPEPVEVEGAEEAVLAHFRYVEDVDGEEVATDELLLVAWFGGDRQLQVRAGGDAERHEDEAELLRATLDTVRFDG